MCWQKDISLDRIKCLRCFSLQPWPDLVMWGCKAVVWLEGCWVKSLERLGEGSNTLHCFNVPLRCWWSISYSHGAARGLYIWWLWLCLTTTCQSVYWTWSRLVISHLRREVVKSESCFVQTLLIWALLLKGTSCCFVKLLWWKLQNQSH